MVDLSKLNVLINELSTKSKRNTWFDTDEFDPMSRSGGNFDDCYKRGTQDGETSFARDILPQLMFLRNELESS